jgi:hypothetical protein
MSLLTWIGYVVVLGFWWISLRREGGLGIGIRFMYGMNLFLFFLFGPLIGELFSPDTYDPRFTRAPMEPAIQLALVAMGIYVASAYWVYPAMTGRRTLIPANFAQRMADPERLNTQNFVAWSVIGVGLVCLPLLRFSHSLPTVGAVLGQTALLVDTGMLMLCLHAAYSRRWTNLTLGAILYIFKYLVFASISGHAGSLFINSMILVCLAVFAVRIRAAYLPALFLIAVLMFIPASYWLAGRERVRTAIKEGADAWTRLNYTVDIFLNPPPNQELDLIKAYRSRGDFSDLMAAALAHTPTHQPYAEGETYYLAVIAVVPRLFWPDKPYSLGGSEFVSRYTGIIFGENTSVGMNYLFEMYVNFGEIGVYLGMAALGMLLGWMESLYYRHARNLFIECALIQVSWTIGFYADRFAMVVMTLIPGVVLVWLVFQALNSLYYLPLLFSPARGPASNRW